MENNFVPSVCIKVTISSVTITRKDVNRILARQKRLRTFLTASIHFLCPTVELIPSSLVRNPAPGEDRRSEAGSMAESARTDGPLIADARILRSRPGTLLSAPGGIRPQIKLLPPLSPLCTTVDQCRLPSRSFDSSFVDPPLRQLPYTREFTRTTACKLSRRTHRSNPAPATRVSHGLTASASPHGDCCS